VNGEGLWTELNDKYDYLTPETAEVVFWVLVNENTRSLQARYPQSPEMWANAKEYSFKYIQQVNSLYSVGEIAMALDGLEYQSCEGSKYHDSTAYKLLQDMRKHLLKQLEDYEVSDTWTIDEVKKSQVQYIN
jgi:tRNA-dihydrouridine synthase